MSGYLIDTHVLLWAAAGDKRLPARTIDLVNKAERRFVSAVSIAEIAIKIANGKLEPAYLALDRFEASGLRPLPVRWSHSARLAFLPLHHRDPFDRLLVAQAIEEGLILVTNDDLICQYPVQTVF